MEEEKEKISMFLEFLLFKYKNNMTSAEEDRHLTEFYIKQCFMDKNQESDDEKNLKYLILGWHIYNHLLPK